MSFQNKPIEHGIASPLPLLWQYVPDWPGTIGPIAINVLQYPPADGPPLLSAGPGCPARDRNLPRGPLGRHRLERMNADAGQAIFMGSGLIYRASSPLNLCFAISPSYGVRLLKFIPGGQHVVMNGVLQ